MGMLKHLQGQYAQSNQYFERAERLSDQLYTISLSDELFDFMTGPSYSVYKGFVFESTFVHYYKALNYLKLAEINGSLEQGKLDDALVEIRRLGNRLTMLTNKTGGYHAKNSEDKSSFALFNILKRAFGERVDSQVLLYKDDAFAHYLSGMLYEMSGDYDSARIEYKKSANGYENGFAKQYELDDKTVNQAWYDTIRVMKIAGGYENQWRMLAEDKLTLEQSKALENITKESTELLVIQHTGLAPQKKELNMILTVDAYSRSLVLSPIYLGTRKERSDQFSWFQMLYADNDVIDIIQNYAAGDIGTVAVGLVTKRIPLGPLWNNAQRLGMISALENGVRIAVSYYPSVSNKFAKTELFIDGKLVSQLSSANSIARIALQEQLIVANSKIQLALTREISKAILAQKAFKQTKGDASILSQLGALSAVIFNAITASADTRNWMTLPAGMKFTRVPVSVGEHQLLLKTTLTSGKVIEQSTTIVNQAGRPKLWHTRTYSRQAHKKIPLATELH